MSVGEVVWPSQWPTELGCFLMTNHTAQSTVENLAEPLAPTGQNAKAIEFLTLAGFTLYGNDWIVPLAGELAISPDEIHSAGREVNERADELRAKPLQILR